MIVLEKVHDAFLARLAGAVRSLRVGPARDPGVRVGPLVDEEARERARQARDEEDLRVDVRVEGQAPIEHVREADRRRADER
mgnify:CR=1 FL=1